MTNVRKVAAGINMDGLQNPVVYNNLIYGNHFGQGIALFRQDGAIVTNGAKIFNNTIIVPEDGRWGILLKAGASMGTEIFNNIIINQHAWRGCIAAEDITGLQSDYNIVNDRMSAEGDDSAVLLSVWQLLGLDQHSLAAPPLASLFQDAAEGDFHLASGSQAVDAGTGLAAPVVNNDLDGNARPFGGGFDIGCYEFTPPDGITTPAAAEILVFPNPANSRIYLEYDRRQMEARRIELADASGRPVRSFDASSHTLDVRNIPAPPIIPQ